VEEAAREPRGRKRDESGEGAFSKNILESVGRGVCSFQNGAKTKRSWKPPARAHPHPSPRISNIGVKYPSRTESNSSGASSIPQTIKTRVVSLERTDSSYPLCDSAILVVNNSPLSETLLSFVDENEGLAIVFSFFVFHSCLTLCVAQYRLRELSLYVKHSSIRGLDQARFRTPLFIWS
jgi:hypothetical protein